MKSYKADYAIAWLTLLSGLSISGVAVYYSVAGLMSIFAAAAIPIMIMGIFLESSKLVATIWLKKYWDEAPTMIKVYLCVAVFILMGITSMGIYGFLAKAHLEQISPAGDVVAKVEIIDDQIKMHQENIIAARKALAQMDEAVDQTMSRSSNSQGATIAIQVRRSQSKERSTLQSEIQQSQKEIAKLNEEKAPFTKELRVVEAEVGPLRYIAALIYDDSIDNTTLEKAVRWVIILIVLVFDPLAVVLLLTSQYTFQYIAKQKENEPVHDPKHHIFPVIPQTEEKSEEITKYSTSFPQNYKVFDVKYTIPKHDTKVSIDDKKELTKPGEEYKLIINDYVESISESLPINVPLSEEVPLVSKKLQEEKNNSEKRFSTWKS